MKYKGINVSAYRDVRDLLDSNRLFVIVTVFFAGTDHMIGFSCPIPGRTLCLAVV